MDLMIDIETLGVSNNAPVISIGACFFDKDGIKEKFYAVLDLAEQIDSGKRVTDASTIKWWFGQDKAAQKIFRDDEIGVNINEPKNPYIGGFLNPIETMFINSNILEQFVTFCKQYDNPKPWGNGSNFDITIVESLLKDYNVTVPWSFRNIRDLRTFKEHVYDGSETKFEGIAHNALDDAIYQTQVVIDGMNKYTVVEKSVFDEVMATLDDGIRIRLKRLGRLLKKPSKPSKPSKLSVRNSFAVFLADYKASRNK